MRTLQSTFLCPDVFSVFRTVITSSHPWIQLFVVSLIFVVWASTMLVWVVDLQERYRNSWNSSYPSDPVPDPPETGYDPLGFGQVRTP